MDIAMFTESYDESLNGNRRQVLIAPHDENVRVFCGWFFMCGHTCSSSNTQGAAAAHSSDTQQHTAAHSTLTNKNRQQADERRRDRQSQQRRADRRRVVQASFPPDVGDGRRHRRQEDEADVLRLADGKGQGGEEREGGLVHGGREEGEAREGSQQARVQRVLCFYL